MIVVLVSCIATSLVPRHSHPQYLITSSMQIQKEDLVTCSDIRYTEGRHTGCGANEPER